MTTPFDLEQAQRGFRLHQSVLLALINTHPDRAALQAELMRMADAVYGAWADTSLPDTELTLLEHQLRAYAKLAGG